MGVDNTIDNESFETLVQSVINDSNTNLKGSRNNLFIDMIRSILTHENSTSKILNPGGFNK
jgi:hypothetical protein